jgi:hypothetical protein
MDLIPGNDFDMKVDQLFTPVEKSVAKVHAALEADPSMSVRGGALTTATVEQRDAVVNKLLNINRGVIPGAGSGSLLAKPVGDDLVVQVGGEEYAVNSAGDEMVLQSKDGKVIRLMTKDQIDKSGKRALPFIKNEGITSYDEFVRKSGEKERTSGVKSPMTKDDLEFVKRYFGWNK